MPAAPNVKHFTIGSAFSVSEQAVMKMERKSENAGFIASRLALKRAVQSYLFQRNGDLFAMDEIEIIRRRSHPPICRIMGAERRDISVSVAHGRGMGAGAVSSSKNMIGIDIEPIRGFSESFQRCFLTEREYREIASLPSAARMARATAYWCIKEAYLKSIGVGLRKHPGRIEIDWNRRPLISDDGRKTDANVSIDMRAPYVTATVILSK